MGPLRAALAALLLLTACASPSGLAVEECNTSWRGLEAQIATAAEDDRLAVPIACMLSIDERRLLIGFEMPPGPGCFALAVVHLQESADAVAVTLLVSPTADAFDSCSTEPARVVTEVDLQAPVGDRSLLDGSR